MGLVRVSQKKEGPGLIVKIFLQIKAIKRARELLFK